MPLPKGSVEAGAALSNSFRVEIPILGTILFLKVGSVEQELLTTQLADNTAQTTGKVNPVETELHTYAHHGDEVARLEAWLAACVNGAPGHKQVGTTHLLGADGQPVRSYLWDGITLKSRGLPELDAAADGDAIMIGWKVVIDNVIFLG